MTNQKVSNEQIYALLTAQQKEFGTLFKSVERIEHRLDRLEHNQERLEDKMDTHFKEVRADMKQLEETMDTQFGEVRSDIAKLDTRVAGLETSRVQWKSWLLVLAMGATIVINFIITRLMLLSGKFAYQPIIDFSFFS